MRISILILLLLALGACTIKPVETVYFEDEDRTRFTTKTLKAKETAQGNRTGGHEGLPRKSDLHG